MNQSVKNAKAHVLVVLSGGMDSTVCAALAVRDFGAENVAALHIDYGQRTEKRERRAFQETCDRLGIPTRLAVKTEFFRAIGGSALTDDQIQRPAGRPRNRGGNPRHLCPLSQLAFPFGGGELGRSVGGGKESISGRLQQDSSGYPDCRPEFYAAFNEAVRTGTKEGKIRIETPLIALRKAEIVMLGLELGAPFDLTWSCYSREDKACGVCDSCVLRMRAFAAAGARDPIPYLSPGEQR